MNLKKIFNFFPPPDFLDIPYSGLSISDDFVRYVKFSNTENGLKLLSFKEIPLPGGAVVSGVINNANEVSNILEGLNKEFKTGLVKVSLPEEKTYLFNTKIPLQIDPKDIRGAIEFKMEENVPTPLSELTFDYIIATPEGHKDHVDVVVSALPTKIVDDYVQTVTSAGISILSLEIESQALARAITPKNSSGTYLIVHLRKNKVGLYVTTNGIVHFTTTIQVDGSPKNDLQYILSEIKKLYVYWHSLKENLDDDNKRINRIVVCGSGADEEVVSYLTSDLKTGVSLANVWVNAFDINKSMPPISFNESLGYAPAVGLALHLDNLL